MFTRQFVQQLAERCLKTVAQALIAVFAASRFDWFHADWKAIVGTALTAGALSILTSIASEGIGPKGTPSIVADPPKEFGL